MKSTTARISKLLLAIGITAAASSILIPFPTPICVQAFSSNTKAVGSTGTEWAATRRATTLRRHLFELRQHRDDNDNINDNNNDNINDNINDNNNDNKTDNNNPSTRMPPVGKTNKTIQSNKDPWLNLMVAASFVVSATLGPGGGSSVARAAPSETAGLDLVSPGTATIEAKIRNGDRRAIKHSTETAFTSLVQTALLDGENRDALTDSVQRLRSSVQSELTSVEAWGKVIRVLDDYGVDLRQETEVVVRPPSDWKRMVDDVVEKQQVNVLINGEILQITTEYNPGNNDHLSDDPNGVVQPDDEWILRVRGYKGFDPFAVNLALEPSKYDTNTPQWYRDWNTYWHSTLTESDGLARTVLGPKRNHGDAILLEGAAALGASYAISYAYYTNEIEKAEEEARQKKIEIAKKKKAAAAIAAAAKKAEEEASKAAEGEAQKKKKEKKRTKPVAKEPITVEATAAEVPVPTTTTTTTTTTTPLAADEATEIEVTANATANATAVPNNVTVTIGFDREGKVVLTATRKTDGPRPNGLLPFLQALYLPWMGFFFPSTAGTVHRPKVVALFQALYFPWAGVFFPRIATSNGPAETAAVEAATASESGNNGVLPFVRALWFPWIGILQGK